MFKTTITRLVIIMSLFLGACNQTQSTKANLVPNSQKNTAQKQETSIQLALYRVQVKLCEGVMGSLVDKSDGCYHNEFLVWGSSEADIIKKFEPTVVLLKQGPDFAEHLSISSNYKFAVESYGCWPVHKQPEEKGFYYYNDPVVMKPKFNQGRSQIELNANQVQVQLITNFDDLLNEQIKYQTSINSQSCKKINLVHSS